MTTKKRTRNGITTIAALASMVAGCASDMASTDGVVKTDERYFENTSWYKNSVQVSFEENNEARELYDCAAGVTKPISSSTSGTFCAIYVCAPSVSTSSQPSTSSTSNTSCTLNITRQAARNRVQDLLFRASAHNCALHEASIYGSSAGWTTVGDVLAAGLAGSAAIVGGFTGQALAAGAGFATATRSIVEKNVYQTYLAPAIIAEIDRLRENKYNIISDKRSDSIEKYSVDAAIVDVVEYNSDCSFYKGVASLTNKAGKTTFDASSLVDAQITKLNQSLKQNRDRLRDVQEDLNKETDSTRKAEYGNQLKKLLDEQAELDRKLRTLRSVGVSSLNTTP